jgi:lipopolysaccharide transport system ATP-binding protein
MIYDIRVENISKKYYLGAFAQGSLRSAISHIFNQGIRREAFWALRNISFNLPGGEAMGLVGPNGAGKSTLLKLIAGIAKPTSGNIKTRGRVASLLELGAGFHPELTGRENVFLYSSILGIKRRETLNNFDRIVAFSELEKFLDTPIKRYSSGMYVRLAFAVAAFVNPDILLVDEVLAVGDAGYRRKCLDRMEELRRQGTSLIFVSHNAHMVRRVCSTVLYIRQGQLAAEGPTEEIIQLYERDLRRSFQYSSHPRQNVEDQLAIEIRDILVTDREGVERDWFSYDEKVKFTLRYEAHTRISSPIFHFRLWRADETACFTIRSNQADAPLDIEALQGKGELSLILDPLQLYGGTYRLQCAIVDATNTIILSMAYSEWFQVSGTAPNIENEHLGVYVPHSKWELS